MKKVKDSRKTESNTAGLFDHQNKTITSSVPNTLPEKYCPNCGHKHQVKSEVVELADFPKGCKHIKYFIDCPDEDGPKQFVKFCAPIAQNVVFMSYFTFKLQDAA